MENCGATPGQTFDGVETMRSGGPDCLPISSFLPVRFAKGDHGPRDVEPERGAQTSASNLVENRVADRNVQTRSVGEAVFDQSQMIHGVGA